MPSKIEYLSRQWWAAEQARKAKLAEISRITGDPSWVQKSVPPNALPVIAQWLSVCRTLAILTDDITRERRRPHPVEMILQ
jgi:hypothetical protein